MTRGWVNDYGDVPRWYWLIRPRYCGSCGSQTGCPCRARARSLVATILGLAGSY